MKRKMWLSGLYTYLICPRQIRTKRDKLVMLVLISCYQDTNGHGSKLITEIILIMISDNY